jgi:predicted regulator of Ras-like GTPase activity (Roadblock/LC7/MglB family)
MATLPQLLEDDVRVLNGALEELLGKSEATSALILDKGGFLISERGNTEMFDSTTLGALAAAAYAATQGIAGLVSEGSFSNVYQQGQNHSLLVSNIDEHCLLVVIFNAQISVGAVKYYAATSISQIAHQMEIARHRSPEEGLDLSILNLADTGDIFAKRGEPEPEPEPAPEPARHARRSASAREAAPAPDQGLHQVFARKGATTSPPPEPAEAAEGSGDEPIVRLQKLKKLLASGLINEEDFEAQKQKILGQL